MTELLTDFMKENKLNDDANRYFKNMTFGKAIYDKNKDKVIVNAHFLNALPFKYLHLFEKFLKYTIHPNLELRISTNICDLSSTDIVGYYDDFLTKFPNISDFNSCAITLDNDVIYLSFVDEVKKKSCENQLVMVKEYYQNYGVTYPIQTKLKTNDTKVKEVKIDSVVVTNNEQEQFLKEESKKSFYKQKKSDYPLLNIEHLQEETSNVKFVGTIFSKEEFVTRANKVILTLMVHDKSDSLAAKCFEGKLFSKEVLSTFKKGKSYLFYGSYRYDNFAKDYIFFIEDFEEQTITNKREDNANVKRVELHVHSKKSEMDGVSDIAELVEVANQMGHRGIAITDHLNTQAFPAAQRACDAINKNIENEEDYFKIIYGVEMNLAPKDLTIVRNYNDSLIKGQEFVIFDLETTGLSAYYDKIIEFGGVIYKNGVVSEKLQHFINPECSVPTFIQNLTHISDNDLVDAPTFKEFWPQLKHFIKDRVLVAHNASFDFSFLNEELIKIGEEPLTNPVIDTLDFARAIFSDKTKFKLGNLCRTYRVPYDGNTAHRADYDADVLASVFRNLLKEEKCKDLLTLRDLQEKLQSEKSFVKARASHVNVIAKNQKALKDLFRLVTISNTDRLAILGSANKSTGEYLAEPRILKEDINKYRKDLFISACCSNSDVFEKACNKGDIELKEAIKFYDYIEVQPLENYRYLIERGAIKDKDTLKKIIKRIIYTAQELGVLIIASGDVHYALKEDKQFRDVYINAKGIGGSRHPLYIYNEERRKNSESPDQYLLNTDEMLAAFRWLSNPDLVEKLVIKNPLKIFNECQVIKPVHDKLYPPIVEGSAEKLTEVCYQTAHELYGDNLPEIVAARLKRELDAIISNGYAVVYYISHLLVKKSNEDGYLVGSRGSVGSSFAATMSKITEVNPIEPHYLCPNCKYIEWIEPGKVSSGYDLPDKNCPKCNSKMIGDGQEIPFETFLGFKGDKVPDIDLNFSSAYQDKAHLFTRDVFGEDHVFRAGTIGTVAEKTAFGYVKGYCEEMGIENMSLPQQLRMASKCEGVKRTTGQHPGGIIVVPSDMNIYDFSPVQYPANNPNSIWKTTHFDFHDIHDNVLKFDILGHVDPTAMRLLQNISGIDPLSIPLNDPDTFNIFSSTKALNIIVDDYSEITGAVGLPEFGTRFVRGILELTRPTTFSDLVRISGLSHGTDVWNNNAKDLIENLGLTLSDVIGCRDDIMTELIHYNLEPSLAFKIMESVRKGKGLSKEWINEMLEHDVPQWYIDSCLKIKYMFPKAHAVAYVIMAIRIAWFKVHYPEYYYVSYFSLRCDSYEIETMTKDYKAIKNRMAELKERMYSNIKEEQLSNKEKGIYDTLEVCLEMTARGYRLSNIDINRSLATEYLVDENDNHTIIPPFTILDGLGENVAKKIIAAREERPFLSQEDLRLRSGISKNLLAKLNELNVLTDLPETNQMSLF